MKSARKSASKKSVKKSAKAPARRTQTKPGQDAVAMLKADHRKVEALFKKADKAKGSAKEKLVEQICNELIIHTTLEEEIFYPASRSEGVEEDMLDEAQVEHDGAKILINELMDADAGSEMYDAKVRVLSEYIKHHVKEEEQPGKGLFAKAKRKGVDMKALGEEMKARKQALVQQAESGGLPHPEPKSIESKSVDGRRKQPNSGASGGVGERLRNMALKAKHATIG